ncbi:MAG: hypothetical protein IKM29_00735 [Clostridia bacterium]|nr:hypothetical protein [Clostridia bacterium]
MSFMSFARGLILGMLMAALAVLIFFPKRRRLIRRIRRSCGRVGRKLSNVLDVLG